MSKVTSNKATDTSIFSEIDLFSDRAVPRSARTEIKKRVGELLVDETLAAVSDSNTPVSGAPYKSTLTDPVYRKLKAESNLPVKANMEFSGAMLDALSSRPTAAGIKIGIFSDGKNAPKADGHNNFSGKSELPRRQFLPTKGQNYKRSIESEIDRIITDAIGDTVVVPRSKLGRVETRADFWSLMATIFGDADRPSIRQSITRSDRLSTLLEEFGLLRFLRG